MRILGKILFKLLTLAITVVLMSSGVRYGQRFISNVPGVAAPQLPGGNVSNQESDLMSTVFKSALRLFSGSAKREDLASELSDKLYSGRASSGDMAELGIELVKPSGSGPDLLPRGAVPNPLTAGAVRAPVPVGKAPPAIPQPGATVAKPAAGATAVNGVKSIGGSQPATKLPATPAVQQAGAPATPPASNSQDVLRARVWEQTRRYAVELGMVPVALLGMYLMHRIRRRRNPADGFVPAHMSMLAPSDSEPYEMKYAVHSMKVEDFELLVALIYQRQGYRVSMPAALGGGRGIDFTLVRKSERVLVQCKRLNQDQRISVEKVRELQDAVALSGATRGIYVASCGFTWDARNYAKAKGLMVINARTLDELIDAARERPDEDMMNVAAWVPKLIAKAEITAPLCPACEAAMEEVTRNSEASVWVCSQRPECRGRRCGRKHKKPSRANVETAESEKEAVGA